MNTNELKQRIPIEEEIGRYVALTRQGRHYTGLCPFHNDHHPSLAVNPERGTFCCFACGERGDVIRFRMLIERISFREAVSRLEEEWKDRKEKRTVVLPPPPSSSTPAAPAVRPLPDLQAFERILMPYLPDDTRLTDTWLRFGVSQAPHLVPDAWKAYSNRIIFPLHDEEGHLIGFAGRRQRDDTDQPKYINPANSSRFQKSEWLYGLYQAKEAIRQTGFVYVVEGYKDLLAMHASGVTNSVAIGGTSLCEGQLRRLQAYTHEVRLMLDGDEAGEKGMERAAAMIRQAGMLCHLFRLPKGEDPDSMFRLMGPTDWITWLRYQWEELYPDPGERLAYRIQKGILLLANEHDPERRQYLLGLLQKRWKETFLNGELKSEN